MGVWDYIIIAAVIIAVVGAIVVIARNKRKGKGCCSNCSKCAGCAYTKK